MKKDIWKFWWTRGQKQIWCALDFCPTIFFFTAARILKFLTANGQRLAGGTRIIETTLGFTQEKNGMRQKEKWYCNAEFYEADIKVDAILSYPWLVQNKIGVLPHRRALITDLPDFVLLYGLGENKSKHFQNAGRVNGVNVVTNGAAEEKQAGKVTPGSQPRRSNKKKAKRREKKCLIY
jgi:hypothetical protein